MQKMSFFNKRRNNANTKQLANALTDKENKAFLRGGVSKTSSNVYEPYTEYKYTGFNSYSNDNSGEGGQQQASLSDIMGTVNKVKGFMGESGGGSTGSGIFSSAADSYISGGGGSDLGIFGSAAASGGSSSAVGSAIGSEVGSSAASSGGGWGGFGGGSGGGGGTPWGAIAGVARTGYDTIMDKDGKEYSDIEQGVIYPLQGAAIGGSYGGGWGALGGALYGLGYAFKDDIGLKDNNWLTTVLFPIGMGDEHEGLIQL